MFWQNFIVGLFAFEMRLVDWSDDFMMIDDIKSNWMLFEWSFAIA